MVQIKKTIGGDRLGSGKKMKTALHNYGRANFNLSENFISSAGPGMLIPFYTNIGLNGDVFDINLDAMVRTIPTQLPLFGTFKLQLDVFQIPIRLYQGLLHNNPINIGMKMQDIKLPKIRLKVNLPTAGMLQSTDYDNSQISSNALLKYIGLSGVGAIPPNSGSSPRTRKLNALPILAYYDIFKNYYSNKQETQAYVVAPTEANQDNKKILGAEIIIKLPNSTATTQEGTPVITDNNRRAQITTNVVGKLAQMYINVNETTAKNNPQGMYIQIGTNSSHSIDWYIQNGYCTYKLHENKELKTYTIDLNFWDGTTNQLAFDLTSPNIILLTIMNSAVKNSKIHLEAFDLENIDRMRKEILSMQELGEEFVIGEYQDDKGKYLPYNTLFKYYNPTGAGTQVGIPNNAFPCNGLVVKTYQSDIYNNWLNTDWIDGENGIAEISAVSVEDGKITMDALNLAEKIYNMLNRIAISGGTYDDWQEAVFGMEAIRKAESPIYCGGMSSEIVFQEVVSQAAAESDGETQALGSLAGKGTLAGRKGGNIHIKINEPSIIMGIMSITPRLCYTQGNAWYMTELDSINDLHKPALDGIGYQELLTEQMHWSTAKVYDDSIVTRNAAGKTPAWINYMTSVDKAFGDFTDVNKAGTMVLSRHYDIDQNTMTIADLTTYIDPEKFNYPFANKNLDAQNFWVQIESQVHARRIMSAKVIPNL